MTWTEIEQFIMDGHAVDPLTGQYLLPTVYDGTIMFAYRLDKYDAPLAVMSTKLPVFFVIHAWRHDNVWIFDKLLETSDGQLPLDMSYRNGVMNTVRNKDGWMLIKQVADKQYVTQRRLIC